METLSRSLLVVAVALALAACTSTGGAASREAASLARYEAAAGETVDSFRFRRLDGFTVLGDDALAIWTSQREAWLLTVDEPCTELRWAIALKLTSFSNRVFARTDKVQGCRIRSIRPVDVAALRESEQAARGAITVGERGS